MKKSVLALAISATFALVVPMLGCAGPAAAVVGVQKASPSATAAIPRAVAVPADGDELTKDLATLDSMKQETQWLTGEQATRGQVVYGSQYAALQQIEQAQQGLQRLAEIRAEVMTAANPSELPAELQTIDKARETVLGNMGSIQEAWQALQRLQQIRAETMTAADPSALPVELETIDKAEETVLANTFVAR